MNSSQILSIITAYNNDPRSFTDKDVELIAMLSKMSGISMRRDVHMKPKPFQKLGFNLADVGMAGMLPDEWEPMSEGEPYFGETKGEKAAGNVGSLLGIAAGIGGVAGVGYATVKGARGLKSLVKNPEFISGMKNPFGSGIKNPFGGSRLSNLPSKIAQSRRLPQMPENPNNLFNLLDDLGNAPNYNIF
tara:strand:+ start:2207 stop:2773 length:567 start_codon:yes stop_codon:yes gene_type:complete